MKAADLRTAGLIFALGALGSGGVCGGTAEVVALHPDGAPLPGANVGVVCRHGEVRKGTTDDGGRWAGDGGGICSAAAVVVWMDGHSPACVFDPPEDGRAVEVRVPPAASVVVSVVGEDGEPAASCDLAFEPDAASRPCPPPEIPEAAPAVKRTEDGRWILVGLGGAGGRVRARVAGTSIGFSGPVPLAPGMRADAGAIALRPSVPLRGVVLRNGKAVGPGVPVAAGTERAAPERTLTDDRGSFAFDLSDDEPRRIVAGALPAPVAFVEARPSAFSGRIEIPQGAALEGQVTDAEGKPVAGAAIRAVREPSEGEAPTIAFVTVAKSGSKGEFAARNLAPGRWRLMVFHPDRSPTPVNGIDLAPGGRRTIAVVLSGTRKIAGRVVDPEGRMAAGAEVRLDSGVAAASGPRAVADEEGRFVLSGLTDAPVRLRAEHATGIGVARGIPGREDVEIVLHPVGEVEGVLVGDAGEPLVDRLVRISPTRSETRTDPQGAFRFRDLPEGEYRVTAEVTDSGDDVRVAAGVVQVVPGEVTRLDLGGAGSLEGRFTVRDSPARRALLVLTHMRRGRPDGNAEIGAVETRADSNGHFRFEGLPEGLHVLRGEYEGIEAARPVRIEKGGAQHADLQVQGEEIEGRVTDAASGAAIEGTRIEVYDERGAGMPLRRRISVGSGRQIETLQVMGALLGGRSDDRGEFRLVVPAGRAHLSATAPGYRDASRELEIAEGEGQRLELTLDRAASLRGSVLDAFGNPIPGVVVSAQCVTGDEQRFAHADSFGIFRIEGLASGRCLVVAGFPGSIAAAEAEAGPGDAEVVLRLGEPASLVLRVVPRDPPAPCPVLTSPSGLPLDRVLPSMGLGADPRVAADTDGCAWPAIPAGAWTLRAADGAVLAAPVLRKGEAVVIREDAR